jgi:hypothetical protein
MHKQKAEQGVRTLSSQLIPLFFVSRFEKTGRHIKKCRRRQILWIDCTKKIETNQRAVATFPSQCIGSVWTDLWKMNFSYGGCVSTFISLSLFHSIPSGLICDFIGQFWCWSPRVLKRTRSMIGTISLDVFDGLPILSAFGNAPQRWNSRMHRDTCGLPVLKKAKIWSCVWWPRWNLMIFVSTESRTGGSAIRYRKRRLLFWEKKERLRQTYEKIGFEFPVAA